VKSDPTTAPNHRKPRTSRRRRLRRLICYPLLAGGIVVASLHWIAPRLTPVPNALVSGPAEHAVFTDRNGLPLRNLTGNDHQRSAHLSSLDSLPQHFIDATLAAEDRRFFSHGGIDFLASLRATRDSLSSRKIVSGASTITQQLVKISLHPDAQRSARLKLVELYLARTLECHWSKEEILLAYLNRLEYGNLNRGIIAAAHGYFDKPPSQLSLAEAAFLAALPQAPTRLNPYHHPERTKTRQHRILDLMAKSMDYPMEEIARAKSEPLRLTSQAAAFHAPHFTAMVLAERPMSSWDGQTLRTTLDLDLQHHAEQRLRHHLGRIGDRNASQGAIVVLDNHDSSVLALVGSRNFHDSDAGQINFALSPRSPGSALKPFTYALAFTNDHGPWSLLADVPTSFPTTSGPYTPTNFNNRYHGPVTARHALANSLNIPPVRLLKDLGGPSQLHDLLTDLGFTSLNQPPAHYGLGLTIGNAETPLLELANAFATLAREGQYLPPRTLLNPATPTEPLPIIDRNACWLVTDILRDNVARAPLFGLNSPLNFPFPVAVKTGTSTDYRDNIAVGYTPEFTVAVWTGNPDNTPMDSLTGLESAAPILNDLITHLHHQHPPQWNLTPPHGIIEITIDTRLGKRVHHQPGTPHHQNEWAQVDNLPPWTREDDLTPDGRARLPHHYAPWLNSTENRFPNRYSLRNDDDNQPDSTPTILFPQPGTVIHLDPHRPNPVVRITLESTHPPNQQWLWSSPSLEIDPNPSRPRAKLVEGIHHLILGNPDNDTILSTWIDVRSR